MATEYYNFQYLPLEGRLPGRDFEQQTEDAINDLGTRVVSAEETLAESTTTANTAYSAAAEAQSTADTALTTANNGVALADAAQSAADAALAAAQGAQSAADAKAPVYHASEATTYGVGSDTLYGHVMLSDSAGESDASGGTAATPAAVQAVADSVTDLSETLATFSSTANEAISQAQSTADSAATAAATALDQSASNVASINALSESIAALTAYETVGAVDLDGYEEYARLYISSGSTNAPSEDEAFFVDVDVDGEGSAARQTAVSLTDGAVYVRWGTTVDGETETDEESEGEAASAFMWGDWISTVVEPITAAEIDEAFYS